jgi:hypothetical protein
MQAFFSTVKQTNPEDPRTYFLAGVLGYILLLCALSVSENELVKSLANIAAIMIFMGMLAIAASLPDKNNNRDIRAIGILLLLYYVPMLAAAAGNLTENARPGLIKLFLTPSFILFGAIFEANRLGTLWQDKKIRLMFWLLALLPMLLWARQIVGGSSISASDHEFLIPDAASNFSIFANRNNAALYAVSLLALFNVLSGYPVKNLLVFFAVTTIFSTNGVLIAMLTSLGILVAKFRTLKYVILAAIVIIYTYITMPELAIFHRAKPVVDSYLLIISGDIDLPTVTYAELVQRLNSTDLSFIFRLKHWIDLFEILQRGTTSQLFFGYGIDSSVALSRHHLVPHNDYLRYLFEFGILGLIAFLSIIGGLIYQCGRSWDAAPLLTIIIYFFCENLVDNYVAMIIFYFCAGALIMRKRTNLHLSAGSRQQRL